jgi:hypothetical protein
MEVSDEQVIT